MCDVAIADCSVTVLNRDLRTGRCYRQIGTILEFGLRTGLFVKLTKKKGATK